MADHLVAADHPMLPGHFPGNPIVPGAWLLSQVLVDAAAWLQVQGDARRVTGVRSVKFLQPVLPAQRFAIDFVAGSDTLRFTLSRRDEDIAVRCATGVLELTDA